MLTRRLLTISAVGWLLTAACTTAPESPIPQEPARPIISIEKPVHFVDPAGNDALVQPGTYFVEEDEKGLRLVAQGDRAQPAIVIQAVKATLPEPVQFPEVITGPETDEDRLQLLVFLPKKQVLDAIGSYSGVRSRVTGTIGAPYNLEQKMADAMGKWEDLGISTKTVGFTFAPGCVNPVEAALYCYFIGAAFNGTPVTPGNLYLKNWYYGLDTTAVSLQQTGTYKFLGGPQCVVRGKDWQCFTYEGTQRFLAHRYTESGHWAYPWSPAGQTNVLGLQGNPSCVFRSPNFWDCFLIGSTGVVWSKSYNGTVWGAAERLSSDNFARNTTPSCVAPTSTRILCFIRGAGDHPYERNWDGQQWSDWVDHSPVSTPQPSLGTTRTPQQPLGVGSIGTPLNTPQMVGDPECKSIAYDLVGCVIRGADDWVYWKTWKEGRGWSTWRKVGSTPRQFTSGPKCVYALAFRCLMLQGGQLFISTLGEDQSGAFGSTEWIGLAYKGGPSPRELLSCVSWNWKFYPDPDKSFSSTLPKKRVDCFAKGATDTTLHQFFRYYP